MPRDPNKRRKMRFRENKTCPLVSSTLECVSIVMAVTKCQKETNSWRKSLFRSHCEEDMEEENTYIIVTRKERRMEWREERKEKREG